MLYFSESEASNYMGWGLASQCRKVTVISRAIGKEAFEDIVIKITSASRCTPCQAKHLIKMSDKCWRCDLGIKL